MEVYFSQYATTGNPHFLDEFAAMYINGWYPPIVCSTATIEKRDRYGIEWDYEFSEFESSGLWIVVFNKNEDKIHVYYYGDNYDGYVDYLQWFSDKMYTQPHIYLDIGIWFGESGIFSVCFPWIKIYRDLSFIIKGLEENWRVLLIDDKGNILGSKTVPPGEESISFHRINDNIIYPLYAHIVVIPTSSDASSIGYIIDPGKVRVIVSFIEGSYLHCLRSKSYLLKVLKPCMRLNEGNKNVCYYIYDN